MTTLYIPANVKTRAEFFPGYGMAELMKSSAVAAIAGCIAFITYSMTESATFPIVLLLAAVAASVAVLVKDQNNMSVMGQVTNMARFSRSQKRYSYKAQQDWLCLAASEDETEADPKRETAQEFVNVRDIRGNILYTKDSKLFAYIKVQPVNISLMSHQEREALMNLTVQELSTETQSFRLVKVSRPVDISGIRNELYGLLHETNSLKCKELLTDEILFLSEQTMRGDILEDQFYFVLCAEMGKQAAAELIKRAEDFVKKLERAKVKAALCDQSMIVQLCNYFANPAYADMDSADMSPSYPHFEQKEAQDEASV